MSMLFYVWLPLMFLLLPCVLQARCEQPASAILEAVSTLLSGNGAPFAISLFENGISLEVNATQLTVWLVRGPCARKLGGCPTASDASEGPFSAAVAVESYAQLSLPHRSHFALCPLAPTRSARRRSTTSCTSSRASS
jgi:hypothetical protein